MRAIVVTALIAWSLGCGPPSVRVEWDRECIKQKFVGACEAACSKLGGAVLVDTPYSKNGWADCLCVDSMKGSNAGWDDHRDFKINANDTVPGYEWNWDECKEASK